MGTQYYDGSFYTFVVGPSWNEAKSNAEKLGGQLVSINTAEEQQFIYDNFVVNADKEPMRDDFGASITITTDQIADYFQELNENKARVQSCSYGTNSAQQTLSNGTPPVNSR